MVSFCFLPGVHYYRLAPPSNTKNRNLVCLFVFIVVLTAHNIIAKLCLTSTFSLHDTAPDVFTDLELDGLTAAAAISFSCQVGTEKSSSIEIG